MTRVRLWRDLLLLAYTHDRRRTLMVLASRAISLMIFPISAIAVKVVVDAGVQGYLAVAVLAAVVVAVAFALEAGVSVVGDWIQNQITDRVAVFVIGPQIARDISSVETIDHLERSDFLDRVAILGGAAWPLLASAWAALNSLVSLGSLALLLMLLGTVHPLLLLLLVFGAVPLWFDGRGQRAVNAAEVATAEDLRVQRHLYELVTTAASGKEIRVSGAGPELGRRQREAWTRAHTAQVRARLTCSLWQAAGWAVFTAGFAGALLLVIHQVTRGHGSLGDVVLSVTVALALRNQVRDTVSRSSEAAHASSRLTEPYLWLRSYVQRERAATRGHLPPPARLRDGITLDRLTFRYPGTTRDAVTEVSTHLPAGSVVAIVGEFGSGKSTLVKLLCKFHRPTEGAIRIDDVDLADLEARDWWSRTAAGFQDFGRYRALFRETVGLGDVPHIGDEARVTAAVEATGGGDLLLRLPQGIETQLGREHDGVELSEGQWQKTALARACMREDPLLFVLDEPTASLDAPSERAIFNVYVSRARALASRTGGITVIISHRFSTVAGADLILVMRNGRLVEQGTHADLVNANGFYAELHNLSSRSYALPS